jgi:hypothetical protein
MKLNEFANIAPLVRLQIVVTKVFTNIDFSLPSIWTIVTKEKLKQVLWFSNIFFLCSQFLFTQPFAIK